MLDELVYVVGTIIFVNNHYYKLTRTSIVLLETTETRFSPDESTVRFCPLGCPRFHPRPEPSEVTFLEFHRSLYLSPRTQTYVPQLDLDPDSPNDLHVEEDWSSPSQDIPGRDG